MASVSREQLFRLVELQSVEIELRKLKRQLALVDESVAALDASLKAFVDAIESKEAKIKELAQIYRSWESEVQDNNLGVQKSEEKLRNVKTNKEYQFGLREIEELKSKSTAMEDKMIQCLEEIEAAELELDAVRAEHDDQQQRLRQEKATILSEAGQTRAEIETLQAKRDQAGLQIPENLLDIFDRVKAQHPDGLAVVRVLGAVCQGCHLNIPPQMYNELQREDSLKMCPHCERIIYWQRADERSE